MHGTDNFKIKKHEKPSLRMPCSNIKYDSALLTLALNWRKVSVSNPAAFHRGNPNTHRIEGWVGLVTEYKIGSMSNVPLLI